MPADAIPSIMRGHQIVVAGDDRQLPPTNFFRQVGDEGDEPAEDDESLVSFGAGFESDPGRAAAAAAHRAAGLALPQPRRAAGGVLQRADLRRRADHLPRRVHRRLPAPRGGGPGARAGPGGVGHRRGGQGGRADPGARPDPAGGVAGRDRAGRAARGADRRGAAAGAGRATGAPRRWRRSSARTGPSRSSSRTWSGSRATSGTRSSCPSATASTATAGCATSGARCCATAASGG